MATNTTFRDDTTPSWDDDLSNLSRTVTLPSSGISNGDAVQLWQVPYGSKLRLYDAVLNVAATLGASATLQARVNRGGVYTAITAASTAGGASKTTGAAQTGIPMNLLGGDVVELLVGGANITASASVSLDVLLNTQPK